MDQQSEKKGLDPRITLILLVLMFVVPVAAAIILHSVDGGWRPTTSTNYGELVTPVRPVAEFEATTLDGRPFNREALLGRWALLTIDSASCDKQCADNLHKIRQVRLGMGGEKERVMRIMMLADDKDTGKLEELLKEHQGLEVLKTNSVSLGNFIQAFEFEDRAAAVGAQRIYIIDPLGNLMMRYPADATPKQIGKDLERLLKYSKIG